ncbi:hypothetical protein GC194_04350 [bacterium]|nr:hypothetical protein [bacterium]
MRKVLFVCCLLGTALLATSCLGNLFGNADNYMSATVDGTAVEWSASGITAIYNQNTDATIVTGLKTSGLQNLEQMVVTIKGLSGEGTYKVDDVSGNILGYQKTESSNAVESYCTDGTIEISKYKNDWVEGTFSGTFLDANNRTFSVSDGKFGAGIK